MNCRAFESLAADWLAGRLSLELSQRMAAHSLQCARCAPTARAERRLRAGWQGLSAAGPSRDPWPSLACRLETSPRGETLRVGRGPSARWAFSGAALLVAVTAFFWDVRPLGTLHSRHGAEQTKAVPGGGSGAVPPGGGTLSALTDVAQVDPAVDDPVGTSMDAVWVQIKTSRKNGQ